MKEEGRYFLKDSIRKEVDFSETDQYRGVKPPPVYKPCPEDCERITLPQPEDPGGVLLWDAIQNRASRRNYNWDPLSVEELSFLLWATQGMKEKPEGGHAKRVVPSAGCRHALETYLALFRVPGLSKGIYRYLPTEHALVAVSRPEAVESLTARAALGQAFAGAGAVTFFWTAVPYRMEWRYGDASYKVIALDAGHVCQNLYLACEAISAGACAIAAYDQDEADKLLGVDGGEEFVVYMAAVGKVKHAG
ncbi:MAG: SagB/ThcOx family dehydrogenase [Thermovirgaceae bacterium]